MSFYVDSIIKLNMQKINALSTTAVTALEQTGEALHTEVSNAEVVPFKDGALHEEGFFVDYSHSKSGVVTLVHSTPYARRMYYHPEYNFHRAVWSDSTGTHGANKNAQGLWFRAWLKGGPRQNFCHDTFQALYRRLNGL